MPDTKLNNNQTPVEYTYVTNGKRTSTILKTQKIGEDIYKYHYDALNNITRIYKNNNLEHRYYYDDYNELIKEKNYLTNEIITYSYDESGNILSKKVYDFNNTLKNQDTYEYSNLNWEDQLTKFNDTTITYDEIGNPLTIGDKTLTWENGRQLKKIEDPNNTIEYQYDNGIRTSKTVNNQKTDYYLEGNKIILEKKGQDMIYYIRNEVDDLIGFEYQNQFYYYMKTIQNDIVGILDQNGNKIATYTYDSWGNILSIKDSNNNDVSEDLTHIASINPFRYRSYYYDVETKLYYLNSRYYNPLWGRFLNVDIGIATIGSINGYNMYQYALNNPINFDDTNGNWPKIGKWFKKNIKKIAIGVAVIAICAVATVVTGGASAGVAGYVSSCALKGALIGGATGVVIGGTSSVIANKNKIDNWNEAGTAFIDGASSGFVSGTVVGAVTGTVSGISNIVKASKMWDTGTFKSSYDSMTYHYENHVINDGFSNGNNIVNYTNDAVNFINRNKDLIQYTYNYSYDNLSWNFNYIRGQGGEFTGSGKIITFWYK